MNNNTTPSNPNQLWFGLQLSTIIIVILLIIIASYYTGKLVANNASNTANSDSLKQYKLLEVQLNSTKTRLSMAENTNKINAQTLEQTRQTILQLEQQIYQQQKDIISYKAIISKQKITNPLVFRDLIIQATEQPQTFRYKLILTRLDQANILLKGSLHIDIIGTTNNQPHTISLAAVTTATDHKKDNIPFSFRYMAMIPDTNEFGEMTLPEDFIPKTIKITAYLTDETKPTSHTFGWTVQPLPIKDVEPPNS
ncbi:DUF6776 family protein [Entomomonas asaccharolytica]|uniref:Uncharacterized protein n=1 Tax=Entomomonas asaccharolytica TaxID=2785331 RepID=A0A974NGN3_9GAMM|nr:DUF6776 family protein [Entomomonas asaccharolytica]QQP86213.1 hypothetical protein JHT90_02930 [Entomomonas asaccharolytica]